MRLEKPFNLMILDEIAKAPSFMCGSLKYMGYNNAVDIYKDDINLIKENLEILNLIANAFASSIYNPNGKYHSINLTIKSCHDFNKILSFFIKRPDTVVMEVKVNHEKEN